MGTGLQAGKWLGPGLEGPARATRSPAATADGTASREDATTHGAGRVRAAGYEPMPLSVS
jgi:hypothetical protein